MLVVFFISLFFLPYETVIYIEITTPRPVWNSRVISPSLLVKNGMIKVDRWWPFLGSQYFLSRLSCSIWRRERKERKSTKDSLPTRLIGPPKLLFSVVNFSPFLNFKPSPFLELLIEEGRLCINRSVFLAPILRPVRREVDMSPPRYYGTTTTTTGLTTPTGCHHV